MLPSQGPGYCSIQSGLGKLGLLFKDNKLFSKCLAEMFSLSHILWSKNVGPICKFKPCCNEYIWLKHFREEKIELAVANNLPTKWTESINAKNS